MERDVLHMMSPYQERTLSRAPSKIVVSGKKKRQSAFPARSKQRASSPRVFDYEA